MPNSLSPCTPLIPSIGAPLNLTWSARLPDTAVIALVGRRRHRRCSARTARDGEPRGRRFCISVFISLTRCTPVGFFLLSLSSRHSRATRSPLPRLPCSLYVLSFQWIFLFCARYVSATTITPSVHIFRNAVIVISVIIAV